LGGVSSHPLFSLLLTPSLQFTGFVAFGVVALLFLVTHELLIEAHESTKESEVMWISMIFFLGIYIVVRHTWGLSGRRTSDSHPQLILNRYLP